MAAVAHRLSWLISSLALGCVAPRGPQGSVPVGEASAPPPAVWSELETMPGAGGQDPPEFRAAGWFDPAQVEGMVVGIAYGPTRAEEAERLAEAVEELNVPLDDVWSVSADSWSSDGAVCRHDQVVYYNAGAANFASSLRASLPVALELSAAGDSRYDVIIQLCPRPPGARGP